MISILDHGPGLCLGPLLMIGIDGLSLGPVLGLHLVLGLDHGTYNKLKHENDTENSTILRLLVPTLV